MRELPPPPRDLPDMLDTVRAFIRNQAGQTDTKPPMPGPGRCELNHAEAMQVADWLDELARNRRAQQRVMLLLSLPKKPLI